MKHVKRALCVLMALALLVCCAPPAALAEEAGNEAAQTMPEESLPPETREETEQPEETEPEEPPAAEEQALPQDLDLTQANVSGYPVIQTAGATSALYFNEDNPILKTIAFENSAENFANAFAPVKEPMTEAAKKLDWNTVVDCLIQFVWNWAGNLQMDENGNSVHPGISRNSGSGWTQGEIRNNRAMYFYDWRLDPWDLAEGFDRYIDDIRQRTGKDKINVLVTSGTGTMVLAYLARYGTDKLASICFNQSMHNGSGLMGQLALRQFSMNADALGYTHTFDIFFMEDIQAKAEPYLKWLYESGVMEIGTKLFTQASKLITDRIYDEALNPIMFMMPMFWAYIPLEYYEAAKLSVFRGDPKYDNFIDGIDRYHYQAQAFSDELLREAAKKIKISLWCGYNLATIPLVPNSAVHSDNLVETFRASNGAICARWGEKLPSYYKQRVADGHNHISPDRLVDASTCALPEQTWFSKNQWHRGEYNYEGWYQWFLETTNLSVFENERYPQFMEMIQHRDSNPTEYVPLTLPVSTWQSRLLDAAYFFLKCWRFLIKMAFWWLG
ncbi:MAG: hypothetical protein LBG83_07900 [Oscillospiraceae bacterium]|nr:hypothetical protein [Oscillospiraceae bacterium]